MGLPFLWSLQGRIEHMNPAFFMLLPHASTMRRHSDSCLNKVFGEGALDAAGANQQALVTAYDVYWSWRALVDGCKIHTPPLQANAEAGEVCQLEWVDLRPTRVKAHTVVPDPIRLQTLWGARQPVDRTCDSAGVPADFCVCF